MIDETIEELKKVKQTLVELQREYADKHWLDENEWKRYCAFKHIEPEIRGCLDREREYVKQIAVLEKALEMACEHAINDNSLFDLVSDFNIENKRHDEHYGIDTYDVKDYFIEKAKEELGK